MIIFIIVSTNCCLVTLPGDKDTDQHWFRVRPGSCRHKAIVWTNDDLLLMGAKEWDLIQNTFSFKKMHLIFSITTLLVWFCLCEFYFALHYNDVIMGTIASQITSLTIVYSTVYSDADQRKKSNLRVTGLYAGYSPGTGEFPAQMASNTENVSIWWRHHAWFNFSLEW